MGSFIILLWRIFATLSALLVLAGILIAVFLDQLIMVDMPLQKADHAIVLDGNPQRLLRAKELLDQGLVNDIYVSNGEPARPDDIDKIVSSLGYAPPDRTEIKVKILNVVGVAAEKIIVFGEGSLTTRDEAKALAERFKGQSPRLMLVTTNYHSRRALEIFEAALPSASIQVTCLGGCVAPAAWWKDPTVAAQFVLEFVKHFYFRLGMAVV